MTDVTDLRPYRAVILGSAVHAGKWLPEAVKFVEQHRSDLAQTPLVYFLVCATLREDTPEHHREVLAYLDPVRALVQPLEVGLFAGKIDADHLPFLDRKRSGPVAKLSRGTSKKGLLCSEKRCQTGRLLSDQRGWKTSRRWTGSASMT